MKALCYALAHGMWFTHSLHFKGARDWCTRKLGRISRNRREAVEDALEHAASWWTR